MTDIAIVIVSYNTRELLQRCLQSVYRSQGGLRFVVCVVDNASRDGSAGMVARVFPECRLIALEENVGYPQGNNIGLRHLGFEGEKMAQAPRYALLLNPDTEVPSDTLWEMVRFMDGHPEVGVAGPRLVLPDGTLDLACRRSFPTLEVSFWRLTGLSKLFPRSRLFGRYNMTYLPADRCTEVDSVVGAFMMVRREAIAQAGLMDETFFMYGEDLDWAYRIKAHGWKVYYNPAVTVLHVKRASSRQNPRAGVEFYRAMRIFYNKHYAANTPRWLHGLTLGAIGALEAAARLKARLQGHANPQVVKAAQ